MVQADGKGRLKGLLAMAAAMSHPFARPLPRSRSCRGPLVGVALLLALLAPVPAQAQGAPNPAAPGRGQPPAGGVLLPRPTEEQQRRIFPEIRRLAVEDHRARIAILQRGERCSRQASNGDGLRACMREERSQMQTQRQRHRDAVRGVMQRNGIRLPEGRPGGGGYGPPDGAQEGWDHSRPGTMPGGMPWR